MYNLFAMWMSNVHSVAGYVFAAGLFTLGLAGWQVFTALLVGITLIYFLTNLAGRGGQKYGIAFAALCRPAFGIYGANIPSMIKATTATAWYGIQTWVSSTALVVVVLRFFPDLTPLAENSILGLSTLGWACFGFMWLAQLLVFFYGWEAIRRFTDWAGPVIYVVMFALAIWIVVRAGGPSAISFTLGSKDLSGGAAVGMWLTAVALTVAWFAGTTLNFADFSRFMRSPSAMRRGNFLGLPVNFMLFAVATVITTSGGLAVFGELITDPVELVARIDNTTAVLLGALTFMTATIATNIVANFVSGAMDVAPARPVLVPPRFQPAGDRRARAGRRTDDDHRAGACAERARTVLLVLRLRVRTAVPLDAREGQGEGGDGCPLSARPGSPRRCRRPWTASRRAGCPSARRCSWTARWSRGAATGRCRTATCSRTPRPRRSGTPWRGSAGCRRAPCWWPPRGRARCARAPL
ncbi:cytosine permease [Microbacterium sp. EF45047]|nr:cytosine permease [Microbacterium sp. EF45047]